MSNEARTLRCSFCSMGEQGARKLITGPNVAICDECVGLCQDILREGALYAAANAAVEPDGEAPAAPSGKDRPTFFCSFCGKSQKKVAKLIAGPTVFICVECVELCVEIVKEPAGASGSERDGD